MINKTEYTIYLSYTNIDNPQWVVDLFKINSRINFYSYVRNNYWAGIFCKRKQLTRVIDKLAIKQKNILTRNLPDNCWYRIDRATIANGKNVSILTHWNDD